MGTGVAGGLSGIALAVPCIGAGSFSNKIPKKKKDRRINEVRALPLEVGENKKVTFCNFGNGKEPHHFQFESCHENSWTLSNKRNRLSSQRRSMHIHAPRRQATPRDE